MKQYPQVHIIHDPKQVEREQKLEEEVSRVGINVKLWESVKCDNVVTGISRAHKQIVLWAKENGKEEVIIAEDDFYFPAGRGGFEYFVAQKPDEYDVYLAGVYMGNKRLPMNRELFQFSGMHFYFVHSRFYDKFLELDETQSIDNAISALALVGEAKVYSLYPMAAIQHENVSSTSGCIFRHKFFFNEDNVYGLQKT